MPPTAAPEKNNSDEFLHAGGDPIVDEDLGDPFADDVPAAPPAAEDPPAEDPPAEDPPAEDPPAEDPPAEDPPAEDPPAEDPPAEEPPVDIRIPKARLDEEVAKRRAAENRERKLQEQLDRAAGKTPKPSTPDPELKLDLGDAGKRMFDKVLDGDLDSAQTLFAEVISKATAEAIRVSRADTAEQLERGITGSQAKSALDQVISSLEDNHPQFRVGAPEYNEDAVVDALALRAGFESQGYAPADAMRKAADYVLKAIAPAPTLADPVPPAPAKPKGPSKEVDRGVKASKQQPPDLPVGQDGDPSTGEVDINNLSDEDLAALPESTIRRLRGDYV